MEQSGEMPGLKVENFTDYKGINSPAEFILINGGGLKIGPPSCCPVYKKGYFCNLILETTATHGRK